MKKEKTKNETGHEIEQERYRVTINFSAEEFAIFKEACELLRMSPGRLIKESLLQESVTNFLKVLIANKEKIEKAFKGVECNDDSGK